MSARADGRRIHTLNMSPTTQAFLRSIADNDGTLSAAERDALDRLATGRLDTPTPRAWADVPLLLTQKQASRALGISRVTLWRMTKDAVLVRVEITPGCFRYRREDVEAVARDGMTANTRKRVERPQLQTRD